MFGSRQNRGRRGINLGVRSKCRSRSPFRQILFFESLEPRTMLSGTPRLLAGFDGMSAAQVGNGEPPDTDGAVGPSSFIAAVNTSLAIYDKMNGQTISHGGITPFSTFFAALGNLGDSFSDPIVVYNDITQKFAVGVLDILGDDARFDLAISKSNNPTFVTNDPTSPPTDWNLFRYVVNDHLGPNGTYVDIDFADFPKIGYNADGFVVSFNMFPLTESTSFDHVSVLGVRNDGTGTGMRLMPGGDSNFTLAPASMHRAAPGTPMWFVGDGHNGKGGDSVNVVRLDNPFSSAAVVSSSFSMGAMNGVPAFGDTTAPRESDGGSGVIPLGSSNEFHLSDSDLGTRFYFSALRTVNGVSHLVSAHTIGNGTGDSVRWYDFNVSTGESDLLQVGTVNPNSPTKDTYFPGIDIAPDGTIGLSYSESGYSEFMSMYVTVHRPADATGTMEPAVAAKTSGQVLKTYSGRAGDYSFISADPVDGTFWATNEYTSGSNQPNWATWIQQFGTIVVSTLSDGNDGNYSFGHLSLREALAIAASAGQSGPDTITFNSSLFNNIINGGQDSIALGNPGQLVIGSDVTIVGPGADKLAIFPAVTGRVITVNSGVTATISGVVIANGYGVASGGGIYSDAASLKLDSVWVIENTSTYSGGGIYVNSGALDLENCTIDNNSTGTSVGGSWGEGGGVFIFGTLTTSPALIVNRTTISANTANGGGGLYFSSYQGGDVRVGKITNSTIADNAGTYIGGLRARFNTRLEIVNSTIADNSSNNGAGAGLDLADGGTAILKNSIVADNFGANIWGLVDTSSNNNLLGNWGTGGLSDNDAHHNKVLASNDTAHLAPLDNYGGLTKTMPPLSGSRAIDGGDNSVAIAYGLVYDERGPGHNRIVDFNQDLSTNNVDIGAVELAVGELYN
jgi:predicted outer membrane repeat protein